MEHSRLRSEAAGHDDRTNAPDNWDTISTDEAAEAADERTDTVRTGHGSDEADAENDVITDPALDDRVGSDWSDEGGATPTGPATDADPPPVEETD